MKKLAVKTAVAILAISIMSLVGCKTIVTDVNAELDAINPKEDLGIPVKYNENYIEVAYNPANASKPAEEDDENKEDKSDLSEDKINDGTEVSSETPENNEAHTDKENADSEEDDADNEEDGNTEDGEDGTEDSKEDAEDSDGAKEDTEGSDGAKEDTEDDNEESDLNASMAEENFDAEFYAATYPDVVAVFGNSPEALYKHYLDYGKAEGRSCNAEEYALLNESSNQ